MTLLLSSSSAQAQTGAFAVSGQAISPFGAPQANARITFCPYTATGVPCSPQATIYADPLLSIPLTQPYATDQFGNYSFWAPSGTSYLRQIAVNLTTTYSDYVTAGGGGGSGGGTVTSISWRPVVDLPVSPTTITTAGTFVQTYLHTPTGTTDAVNPAGYHVFVFNNEPNLYYPIIKATNSSAPATDQIGFDQFSSVPAIQYVSGSGLLFTTGPANSDNVCFRGYGSQYNFNTSCIGPELGGSQFAQTWNDIGSPGKLEVALVPQSLGNPAIAPTQILWLNNFTTTSTTATAVSCSGTVATITDTQSYAGGQWLYFAAGFSPSSLVGMQQVLTGPTGSSFQVNSSCGGTGTGGTIDTATAEAAGNYIATGALDQTFHFGFSGSDFGTWNSTNLSVLGTGPGTIGVYDSSGSNALTLTVPSSVTPYTLTLPGLHATSGNTYLSCTAANPSVCSWGTGGGSVSGVIGNPMIGTGTSSSTVSQPDYYDIASFTGADFCAKLAAAFAQADTLYGSYAGTFDGRSFTSNQSCASNPFAASAFQTTGTSTPVLIEMPYLPISQTAAWSWKSNNVVIHGQGDGGTSVLQAASGYPSGTPQITIGDCSTFTNLNSGNRIENWKITATTFNSGTVVEMCSPQEHSGIFQSYIYGGNSASATAATVLLIDPQNMTAMWKSSIDNSGDNPALEISPHSTSSYDNVAIDTLTVNNTGFNNGTVGVKWDGTSFLSHGHVTNLHCEGFVDCTEVGANVMLGGGEINTTGTVTTSTVLIDSGTCGGVNLQEINDGSSTLTNLVLDNACSVTLAASSYPYGSHYGVKNYPLITSGGSIDVNGSPVSGTPNFQATTPAAPNGSTNVIWAASSSSVSGSIPNLPASYTTLGAGECLFSDSSGVGLVGTLPANEAWYSLLSQAYGGLGCYTNSTANPLGPGTYYHVSSPNDGNSTCLDVLDNQILPNVWPVDTQNQDYFITCGVVDSWIYGSSVIGAGTMNEPATMNASLNTIAAVLGTTAYGKVAATNSSYCTTTGTWTALNTFKSGIGLQTTSSGATITCTTPYAASGAIYQVWDVYSTTGTGTATATYTQDGVSTDTWSSALGGAISSTPGNTAVWWGNRYPLTGSGTHTWTITVTAASSAAPFGYYFAALPTPDYTWAGLVNPNVYINGVQYVATDAYEPYTGLFNGYVLADATQLQGDGFNVRGVNQRAALPENSYSPPSSGPWYEFNGGTYDFGQTCSANGADVHANECGMAWEAFADLQVAHRTPSIGATSAVTSFGPSGNIRTGAVTPATADYTCAQVTNCFATNAANTATGSNLFTGTSNTFQGATVLKAASPTVVPATFMGSNSGFFTPALLQNHSTFFTNATTMSSSLTLGSTLLAVFACNNNISTPPTDSGSQTWVNLLPGTPLSGAAGGGYIYLWAVEGTTSATAVTITSPSACTSPNGMAGYEFSNLNNSSLINAAGVITNPTFTNPQNTGNITTTTATTLLWSIGYAGNFTLTSSGWTQVDSSNAWADGYAVETSTGTYHATYTYGAPGSIEGLLIIAFNAAPNPSQTADYADFKNASGTKVSWFDKSAVLHSSFVQIIPTVVASLPSCTSSLLGSESAVTDALSPTYLGTVTGGGTLVPLAPVVCNGTNWVTY